MAECILFSLYLQKPDLIMDIFLKNFKNFKVQFFFRTPIDSCFWNKFLQGIGQGFYLYIGPTAFQE